MSFTHSEIANGACSCDSASEVKRLKKQILQLTDEVEELKRDKRSFRESSDESRRNLAKMREEMREMKRKNDLERQEKEEYADMVRKLKQVRFSPRSPQGFWVLMQEKFL